MRPAVSAGDKPRPFDASDVTSDAMRRWALQTLKEDHKSENPAKHEVRPGPRIIKVNAYFRTGPGARVWVSFPRPRINIASLVAINHAHNLTRQP